MTLDKHAVHGASESLPAVGAAPQALADRAHVKSMLLSHDGQAFHCQRPGTKGARGAGAAETTTPGLNGLPFRSARNCATNASATPFKVMLASVISVGRMDLMRSSPMTISMAEPLSQNGMSGCTMWTPTASA